MGICYMKWFGEGGGVPLSTSVALIKYALGVHLLLYLQCLRFCSVYCPTAFAILTLVECHLDIY